MSHGHSHGGRECSHDHGGGGHGHSHGGPPKPAGLTEQKLNELFDDEPISRVLMVSVNPNPNTLEEAAECGNLSAAIMAHARGSDVKRIDNSVGATSLHWAAFKGHIPVMKFLVDRGADVNFQDNRAQSPLMWAIVENRLEAAHFLLEHGADPCLKDKRGCDGYSMAAQNGSLAMLHLLHTHRPLPADTADNDGHNLIVWAAYKGHLAVGEYLHTVHKVNPAALDGQRRTALHWAAREGHTDVCVWLMSLGLSPAQPDNEGMTPLAWAARHHHVEAQRALARNQTVPDNKVFGTLKALTTSKWFALMVAVNVVYFAIAYPVVSRWFPSAIAYSLLGCIGARNFLAKSSLPTPIKNSVPEPTIQEMVGAPKTFEEAMRGLPMTNFRDPGVIVLWAGVVAVQHIALDAAGVTPSDAAYYGTLLTLVIAAAVCKASAFRGLVPRGTVLEDPVLRAVERREFEDCRWQRIYRTSHHLRVPLRAFHCKELDEVIEEYDGWSLMLDAPVSGANRRSFVAFITALLLHEAVVLHASWSTFATRHCSKTAEFSLFSTGFNLFFSALPCRVPTADATWWRYVAVADDNHYGVWLIAASIVLCFVTATVLLREVMAIQAGLTVLEGIHRSMPSTSGGLTPIFRNGHSVFSAGSPLRNVVAFVTGSAGRQWRNATAIPPPQSGSNKK